jgi:acyl-CoA synthetase (AMP-forming)/AMP-acid ligase II
VPLAAENFAAGLPALAARSPDATALVVQGLGGARDERTSWRELADRTARMAHGLAAAGVKRGDRACVFLRPGRDWLALTYALLSIGAVPVLIDPGMGRRGLLRCIERCAPRVFIGIPRAHALRLIAPGSFKSVELAITAGSPRLWSGPLLERLLPDHADALAPAAVSADDEAAILFTSGATGPAKGVVYTHGMFAAQRSSLRELYGFRPGEVDLACLPLFALFAAHLEWTSVLPDLDVSRPATCDPARIAAAIREHGVTNTFGSPAIWRRVAPWCREKGVKLESLRRLMIAGAPVPPRLVQACREVLGPDGEVHTPYGATEALPVADARGSELLGALRREAEGGRGVCVGRAAPGIRIALIRIGDEPIERWSEALRVGAGEAGEICVQGAHVTARYENEREATAAAKIPDPAGSFWHRMGDVGRLDESGNLWFLGRKAHRIETSKGVLMPVGLEQVFDLAEHVERTAVVGVGARGAERPLLVVQPKPGILPRSKVMRERLAIDILRVGLWHPACSVVEGVLFKPELPVDVRHNAKIDRAALKAWAERRSGQTLPSAGRR